MKKLSTYLLLILFSFSAPSFADDIRDFEIEGISIGDSLLDYYSEEEIKNNSHNYYNNKTYTPVEMRSTFFTTYESMSFNYKTNDKNYIIFGMNGHIDFINDIEKCEKMKKNILKEIKGILIGKKFNHWEGKLDVDPSGKYIMDGTRFDSGDKMSITCYDYSEESGFRDHLNISFFRKHFNEFLGYAYD